MQRVKVSKIQSVKNNRSYSKETKLLRFRLAETETPLAARIPGVVRRRPRVEPQTVVVAFQVEDVRVAVRIGLCDASSMSLPA